MVFRMVIIRRDRRWILKVFYIYTVALVVFALIGDRGLLTSYGLWKESRNLDQEVSVLRAETQELYKQVQNFRNDDRTIEQYAREKLNLSGENEIQFIFK